MNCNVYSSKDVLRELIEFVKSCGIDVHTNTKARGNNGFFRAGRIDISYLNNDTQSIKVLIHEFAHFINSKLESDLIKNHGKIEILFPDIDIKTALDELYKVTLYIDKSSRLELLKNELAVVKGKIKNYSDEIKRIYPDFKRSQEYKPIDKILKKSELKYFLKYDRFRFKKYFFTKSKIYSIDSLDFDFPETEEVFKNYIYLRSYQRKQKRISSRISKYKKYYNRPTELFARFVECFFLDNEKAKILAPNVYAIFLDLLNNGYYCELKNMFDKFFLTNKINILKEFENDN